MLILEVALDAVAVENTIIPIVPEGGWGQPLLGPESLCTDRAGPGLDGLGQATSRCLLGSPNAFLITKVINDYFSKTAKVSK